MTLPTGGQLDMNWINAEFGRGHNLNSYRNTLWYTDSYTSGYFPGGQIAFSDFWGKRATPVPLSVNYWGAASSSATAGSLSYTPGIGAANARRYVVVVAWSNDSNGPVPNTCTVAGQATTRVALRSGAGALAIFITNSPVVSGTTATCTVNWSGSSVSNRAVGVYTVIGNVNTSPAGTFSLAGTSTSIYVGYGGVIISGVNLRNSTAGISMGGLSLNDQGTVASHRWAWGSYAAGYAENRALSISPSANWVGVSFNPY